MREYDPQVAWGDTVSGTRTQGVARHVDNDQGWRPEYDQARGSRATARRIGPRAGAAGNSPKVRDPKAVQDTQKELITRKLRELSDMDTRNSGLAITVSMATMEEVKKALPGMSEHGGEVKLDGQLTLDGRELL